MSKFESSIRLRNMSRSMELRSQLQRTAMSDFQRFYPSDQTL